jgi:hypothetical protein
VVWGTGSRRSRGRSEQPRGVNEFDTEIRLSPGRQSFCGCASTNVATWDVKSFVRDRFPIRASHAAL